MNDNEWVVFLQWALPQMQMRWTGFRRVRRQVCKRIAVRLEELHLARPSQYKDYLADHPEEWNKLDSFCHITISRFYRDKSVFQFLQDFVLQELAKEAKKDKLRCWCCGCAAGEEPFTLSLIWYQTLKPYFPETDLEIIATDFMDTMLNRALTGRYRKSSVKELPDRLLRDGFTLHKNWYILKEVYRSSVRFLKQDVRKEMPAGPFQIIFCRYLVFTYFDEKLQTELLEKLLSRLVSGGALVLGEIDRLPCKTEKLEPWSETDRIYRKIR
jgi:chemotaxis protein methyltransferase CheR